MFWVGERGAVSSAFCSSRQGALGKSRPECVKEEPFGTVS